MNLDVLSAIGNTVKGIFGLADQLIEDKDKKNELNAKLLDLQTQVTLAVIEAEKEKARIEGDIAKAALMSDLPKWARVLYLFGRQLYAAVTIVIVAAFQALGTPLDANTIMMMVAPGTVYAAVKGSGTKL